MSALLLLSLLACRPEADAGWTGRRVVLLVLDGVRDEDSFGDGPTVVGGGTPESLMPASWADLVSAGARATAARSAGITVTGPAHVTLLTGQHAPFGNYHNEAGVGTYRPDLPTLPESLRAAAGLGRSQVLVAGNTSLIEPTAWSHTPGLGEALGGRWALVGNAVDDTDPDNGGTDDTVVFDRLRQEITDHAPVLVVANLHQTDRSTHNGEFDDYEHHLTILDGQLPAFWDFLQDQPDYADNTWLIVASDHGRHDQAASSPPWRHHGDSCQGCRGVPWLVLGPGVRAGQDFPTPVLLEDTATTIAAMLGTPLPFSEGRVIDEAFSTGLGEGPTGVRSVAIAGDAVATRESTGDPAHRYQVSLDGQVVSEPDAFLLAGPTLAQDGDQTWLCLRSLTQDPDADEVPWIHRCGLRSGPGGPLVDLAMPWTPAAPYEEPALLTDGDGGLVLITASNPTGVVSGSGENDLGLRAAHYSDGVWQESLLSVRESFPTLPAALLQDDAALVVVAAGPPGADSRHGRGLYQSSWSLADGDWAPLTPLAIAPATDGDWGLERPALGTDNDGSIVLAGIGTTVDQTWLVRARSSDGGATWAQSAWLDGAPPVLPHLTPRVVLGRVHYGALDPDSGEALVCSIGVSDPTPSCASVGAAHLGGLALRDDGATIEVVVAASDGRWRQQAL